MYHLGEYIELENVSCYKAKKGGNNNDDDNNNNNKHFFRFAYIFALFGALYFSLHFQSSVWNHFSFPTEGQALVFLLV